MAVSFALRRVAFFNWPLSGQKRSYGWASQGAWPPTRSPKKRAKSDEQTKAPQEATTTAMNIVNGSVLHRLHSARLVRSLGRCILVSILVLVGTSALAGEFLEAETLRKSGFYTDAFPIYMRLAEAGNAPAQNAVGVMLQGGLGTPENLESSVVWLKRSAEQGYAPAQSNLGAAYRYGRGKLHSLASQSGG